MTAYCSRKRSPYVGSLLPLGPEVLGTKGLNQSASVVTDFARLLDQHAVIFLYNDIERIEWKNCLVYVS
jgi:hypothetical protein